MKKRVVSLLLCLIMALSLIPTVAFAAEPVVDEQPVEETLIAGGDKIETASIQSPLKLGWMYANITNDSGTLKVSSASSDKDFSKNVTVTLERPLSTSTMAKGEYYYNIPLYAENNKVTVTAKGDYYIAYVAFCCRGSYDLFSSNPYGCTAPQELYADNGSNVKSVSFTLKQLRDMQKQAHKEYCWLMVMLAPTNDTPVDPNPTGTLTVTKNIVGLSYAQVPVEDFGYIVNLDPDHAAAPPLFTLNVTETTAGITATNSAQLNVGKYSLTETHLDSQDVAGYKCVTTFAIDGVTMDTWDHSDPTAGPDWSDFNIVAGGTTNIVITDTYTPIGNDENNYATISIKKYETGNENNLLAGAKFKLEKLDGTNWVAYGSVGTTDANSDLVYTIMDAGDYKLTEVEAPAGYKLSGNSEWTFTVVKSSSTKPVDNKIVNVYDYKITKVGKETIAAEDQVTTHLFEIANTKIPTVAVAIQKVVKVTGNTAPGSVVFTFGAKYQDTNKNWVELACANNTITTNGTGTYTRNDMTITLPDTIPAGCLEIVIYEKNDGRANWTYSKDTYKLHVLAAGTIEAVPATNSTSATLPSVPVYSFENTYSYTYTPPARPSDPIRRQPTTTTTKPVQSVKTGDMGIALYVVTSLLSLSGTALLIKKRKDEK